MYNYPLIEIFMVNIFVYRVQVGLQFEGGGHHAKYEYSTACSDIFTPREVEMGIKNNDSRPFYVHITVSIFSYQNSP